MSSLAYTDALLCVCALAAAGTRGISWGVRLACGLLAVPALLGFLRFSGLYPMPEWHLLWSILGASAGLPLLAVSVRWPQSRVSQALQFALIFLGGAMLLGLLIAGLGRIRLYDQIMGLGSIVVMAVYFFRQPQRLGLAGALLMLAGSLLFVAKLAVPPWWAPGDWLHVGMAAGLLLVAQGVRRNDAVSPLPQAVR